MNSSGRVGIFDIHCFKKNYGWIQSFQEEFLKNLKHTLRLIWLLSVFKLSKYEILFLSVEYI